MCMNTLRKDFDKKNWTPERQKTNIYLKGNKMKKQELQQIIREELSKTLNENSEKYMFFQNLETIKKEVEEMLSLDPQTVDAILANGHDWAADHISTSKDDIEEVHNFLMSNKAPMDELSKKQQKIAKAAPPEDKITGADFAALRKGK